jgi:hypothetical protein
LAASGRGGGTTKGGATEERLFGVDWEQLRRRIGAVKTVALILAVATFAALVGRRKKETTAAKFSDFAVFVVAGVGVERRVVWAVCVIWASGGVCAVNKEEKRLKR